MRKFFGPAGSVSRLTVESEALKSNMLGDPSVRAVDVYIPAGHDGRDLPLLVDLVGFTSSGLSHTNWTGFQENMPERLDRLIGEQRMKPVVVAFPDCFTRLGGNQYINSASTGAWEDFLLHEMLPAIERRFGCGGSGRRGVFGKSSGGYGAITHALRHADIWAAAACHSGDMGFEICYLPDMPDVLRALAGAGLRWKLDRALVAADGRSAQTRGFHKVVNALAMAASYDPDPTQFLGIRLPVTFDTCEIIEERWANWLRQDPAGERSSIGRSAPAEGALYRLRRVGPVQSALWRPQAGAPAERPGNSASLRGVFRQPQRRRLPDGREPALSRPGPIRVTALSG